MWFGLLALCALVVWVVSTRANELCTMDLSTGGARLVRGRAPRAFLAEAADIARRAGVKSVRVRVVVESQVPRLIAPATLREDATQQLRNVLGRFQVTQFRAGSSPE